MVWLHETKSGGGRGSGGSVVAMVVSGDNVGIIVVSQSQVDLYNISHMFNL